MREPNGDERYEDMEARHEAMAERRERTRSMKCQCGNDLPGYCPGPQSCPNSDYAKEEEMHEYTFDVKLFATINIKAENEAKARELLEQALDRGELDCGLIDGQPVKGNIAPDGDHELTEVDGEAV